MQLTPEERILWRRAIASSAFYGARHMPIRAYFKAAFAVVKAAIADHGDEVALEIAERRMEVCRGCAVFVEKTGCCGPVEFRGERLGCSCFMRALSQLKNSHCWLREEKPLSGLGWPDDLL